MTRHLPLLSGYPYQLRILADALRGSASRLSAVNTVLLGLRAGATWDSDSGRLFEAAVHAPPPLIAAVIERYAGASRAIRTLADELEEAQGDVTAAIASHTEAWRRHDTFMDRRSFAVDPEELQDLERAMDAEIAVVDAAERRHLAAVHRHREADLRCARTLSALARDTIDDPAGYAALVDLGKISTPVALVGGLLPGPGKLVGVAGIAGAAVSQVGVLVLYDEGSWKQIGVNVLSSAVTTLGSVLVAGAGIGGTVVLEGGRRAFTKSANPTTGYRMGAGARATFDEWIDSWRTRFGLPVTPRAPRVPPRQLPRPTSLAGRAGNVMQRKVDDAFGDSWRLATANGPRAQQMFVAGVTLQNASKVVSQIDTIHERVTSPEPDRSQESGRPVPRSVSP